MEQNKWETTFQVSIPDILEPEKFTLGRKKFLDRLWREIEPIREELGYPADASNTDKLIWRIDNKDRVAKRMSEICSQLWLPDNDDFVNLLVEIFFDGIEASPVPLIESVFSPNVRDATPLFFLSVAIPPDIDNLDSEDRERFLTNGLYVEGMIPGLSKESFTQIFKHKGDYIIRGNLSLFNASAFREIGKWLEEIKNKIGSQDVFKIKPGRSPATSVQNDEMALQMYETYLGVRRAYQGKKRKLRKGHSRYDSIYDEVGRNYEAKYRLGIGSISNNRVKYLIQKGKRSFVANREKFNPA